jgi:hypothetical protein
MLLPRAHLHLMQLTELWEVVRALGANKHTEIASLIDQHCYSFLSGGVKNPIEHEDVCDHLVLLHKLLVCGITL